MISALTLQKYLFFPSAKNSETADYKSVEPHLDVCSTESTEGDLLAADVLPYGQTDR